MEPWFYFHIFVKCAVVVPVSFSEYRFAFPVSLPSPRHTFAPVTQPYGGPSKCQASLPRGALNNIVPNVLEFKANNFMASNDYNTQWHKSYKMNETYIMGIQLDEQLDGGRAPCFNWT